MREAAPSISYFVHDVHDATVRKRVRMFHAGGAQLVVFGFRRQRAAIASIEGAEIIDLGLTEDGNLAARGASVINVLMRSNTLKSARLAPIFVARNLEMLAIACWARARWARHARVVYECLDLHRMMLDKGAAGTALRAFEKRLLAGVDLIVTSSPAYIEKYFAPVHAAEAKCVLVENKVLALSPPAPPAPRGAAAPWRIGWFGVLRCKRSLELLCDVAARCNGQIEIVLRGKLARGQLDHAEHRLRHAPHITYLGPYAAEDLPALYADVHLAWAIDYYEAGGNSNWLLPNRLYEAGAYGVPAIAAAGVETGRWLKARGAGLVLDNPERDALSFLSALDEGQVRSLQASVAALPVDCFVAGPEACRALVHILAAPRAT